MTGKKIYDLVKALDFARVSGTDGEARAAEIIRNTCHEFGLETVEETFATQDGVVDKTRLVVMEPYQKEYPALGYRRSGSLNGEGEMLYAEDALEVNLARAQGKILLLNGGISYEKYETLIKAAPMCVITGSGDSRDNPRYTDIAQAMFRPMSTDRFANRLVAIMVRSGDLLDMIRRGARRAHIVIQAGDVENMSRNVTATVPGTLFPDEIIALTAHYDSVEHSHGLYDNASGSAIMTELARYFLSHPPKRTLRFVWCGSEERGLLGSKAFVSTHKDEIEKTKMNVNFDLAGSIAGHEFAIVTGPEALVNHIDMFMKENGWAVEVKADTYASDCIPFADSGVPAVSIGRFGAGDMSYIHDRRDAIQYVSAGSLAHTGQIALQFVRQMDSAEVFPVKRAIPDDMCKKIDKYLHKEGKNTQ